MANLSKLCNDNHKLKPEDNGRINKCSGCKTNGHGLTYRCNDCGYDFHKECMHPKATISPEIFEGDSSSYDFKFFKLPPPGNHKSCKAKRYCLKCRKCDACGMDIEGFVYHCKKTDMDLHPRCASLPREIPILGDDLGATLLLTQGGAMLSSNYSCNLCQSAGNNTAGWSYLSDYGGEEFGFHVHCVMLAVHTSIGGGNSTGAGTTPGKITKGNPKLDHVEKKGKLRYQKCLIEKKRGTPGRRTELCLKIFESALAAVISAVLGDAAGVIGHALVEGVHSMFS